MMENNGNILNDNADKLEKVKAINPDSFVVKQALNVTKHFKQCYFGCQFLTSHAREIVSLRYQLQIGESLTSVCVGVPDELLNVID